MTSFVDVMGSTCWSEADIVNRTEAILASQFPASEQMILSRKATGAALGQYALSPAEQQELGAFAAASLAARVAGDAARADMALLTQALAIEAAQARLLRPALGAPVAPPAPSPQPGQPAPPAPVADPILVAAYNQDVADRAAAQAVLTAAAAPALALVATRAAANAPPPTPAPTASPAAPSS